MFVVMLRLIFVGEASLLNCLSISSACEFVVHLPLLRARVTGRMTACAELLDFGVRFPHLAEQPL